MFLIGDKYGRHASLYVDRTGGTVLTLVALGEVCGVSQPFRSIDLQATLGILSNDLDIPNESSGVPWISFWRLTAAADYFIPHFQLRLSDVTHPCIHIRYQA